MSTYSSSSSSPTHKQSKFSGAVRVETPTKQATHNAVKAEDLSVFIGHRQLLSHAELKIAEQSHTIDVSTSAGSKRVQSGTCYGLVGVNGCGKSTLLRLIAEERLPVPPSWDVFIVSQHLPTPKDHSSVDEVLLANRKRASLLREQSRLEQEMSMLPGEDAERFDEASARLVALQTELSQWEGAETEVTHILRALGFGGSQHAEGRGRGAEPTEETPMSRLSGGWRMKVELAKALWLKPKLLLLDEPTNHLDFHSLQWLAEQLEQYPHTSVVVSHDVSFLHGICREILWMKDAKLECLPRSIVSQEDLLRMQRSRALSFHFPTPENGSIGNQGLSLHGVEFNYGDRSGSSDDYKLRVGEVRFGGNTRAVLLGKNGTGKSTFLDLCAGRLKPIRGGIDTTPELKVGHYSQFTDEFDRNATETAAAYLVRNCREELAGHAGSTRSSRLQASIAAQTEKQTPAAHADAVPKASHIDEKRLTEIARGVLSNFGFEGDVSVTVPIDCLSGGQKALLKFAKLSLQPCHILLLDEPSNHLDAEACEALANGLSQFKGGIVAVTHDELLIYRLINCNWLSSELLICRDGQVWRQQNFAADCLKALTKEVRGAEDGQNGLALNEKQRKKAEPAKAEQDSSSDTKQTTVVTTNELPPWLQKKARAKRTAAGAGVSKSAEVDQKPCVEAPAAEKEVADSMRADDPAGKVARQTAAKSSPRTTRDAKGKAQGKASAKKSVAGGAVNELVPEENSRSAAAVEKTEQSSKFQAPAVVRNQTKSAFQKPNDDSTWEDELWQLKRFYDTCEVTDGDNGERIVRLTHHCTDPDWNAEDWAPMGLQFEVRVGRFYPEPPVQEPTLIVLGPECLPEKFTKVMSLLFAESVSRAPVRTPAIYRGLQYLDKNMTVVWCKVQTALQQIAATEKTSNAEGEASSACPAGEAESEAAVPAQTISATSPAPTDLGWSIEDARRLGLEVRLLGLTLEGFSELLPIALRFEVVCGRCRKPMDIGPADGVDGSVPHAIAASCPTCKGELSVQVVPSSCSGGCQAIAQVLGIDCYPVNLRASDYKARCAECSEVARIRNVSAGYRKQSKCNGCHAKLNFAVEDADLLGREVQKWRLVAEEEGDRMTARKQLQEARRMEKGLGIKVGQPLPDKGACKHYRQAFRWLRFPCCGRAFPCDQCHDEQTDHSHEWATRMLCGLCSHEQPFTKDQCTHCGASQNKSRGGYWEGGDGCRDRTKMAKDDPHKYKGLGKTVAKKK